MDDITNALGQPPRSEDADNDSLPGNRLLAAVMRSVSDPIITKTTDGRITGWNRAAERLFGYSADEAIGQPIAIIVPPNCLEESDLLLERGVRGESIEHFETTRCTKSGRIVDVQLNISPITAPSGEVIGTAKIVRDITEHRFVERKFQLAVEACPSGILMIDGRGTVVLVNAELERQFGYDRAELAGKTIDFLLPTSLREAHARHREQFRARPLVRAMGAGRSLYGRRKDGSEFPVEIGLNPFTSQNEAMVLATVIDITARKQAEQAVEAQNEKLRRSNEELEKFAYVASHDLQEPLRMVASFTQLLKDRYGDQLDDKAHKYIGFAVEGARRMQTLVRDLLAYSRLTSADRVLKPIDSSAVVAAVVDRLAKLIAESGADVRVDPLPMVVSDEVELGQVFQNLISNAIKFRAPDRVPQIMISAAHSDGRWEFSVTDNGIGIDAKFSERIFQMFQRLHERGKYEGSGIGLAIAQKIVERHGGRIWFDSELERGTTFHFTLASHDQRLSHPAAAARTS